MNPALQIFLNGLAYAGAVFFVGLAFIGVWFLFTCVRGWGRAEQPIAPMEG